MTVNWRFRVPDGETIAFLAGSTARKVPARGGAAVAIPFQGTGFSATSNLVFAGIEFTSQTIDATAMTGFHMIFVVCLSRGLPSYQ